jgi:predicted Zn-dependent protease with MMP-like domain
MDKIEFENLVKDAIADLPAFVREKMDNVAVVVDDAPNPEQMSKGRVPHGHLLLGLYEGVPRTKRNSGYTMVLPDKITIFQNSIEAVASTPELMRERVKNTVWHEVAHHFGFDENAVRDLDRRRKSRPERSSP